jgi:hypothetical protein
MSDLVQNADDNFVFDDLTLANPQGLQGGAYFSKLRMSGEPVLIQTPKCSTKNGIHKTEKKIYCDLMFTCDEEDFINWVQSLETTVKNLIYEKRDLWFHNDMDRDSIDYHWQNLLRTYKGNKSLLRCFINKSKGLNRGREIQIYNEEEKTLTTDDITKESQMISILEISGLKFTTQSFQIEFMIKQMMIIEDKPIFNKCLIKIAHAEKPGEETITSVVAEVASAEVAPAEVAPAEVAPAEVVQEAVPEEVAEALPEEVAEALPEEVAEALPEEVTLETETKEDSDAESDISVEDISHIQMSEITEGTDSPNHIVAEPCEDKDNSGNGDQILSGAETGATQVVDVSKNTIIGSPDSLEKTVENVNISAVQDESLDKNGIMNEIEILAPGENTDAIKLKNPNEVYMEIYKEARNKAREAKKNAIQTYLEAKRIKSLYLLDEIESSDEEMEFGEYGV